MYKWYQHAQVCYAYLVDVTVPAHNILILSEQLWRSQWFERGWTLQELLAPAHVDFYNRDWVELGTKSSLAETIKEITGITHLFHHRHACVAQKMSWAANRKTTREEDLAYCLMGLFDINMPTLYGEGDKAFLRLQLEILSKSDDESIFAWDDIHSTRRFGYQGLLAPCPVGFESCRDVKKHLFDEVRPPHTITNKGIGISALGAIDSDVNSFQQLILAPLNCAKLKGDSWKNVCLRFVQENDNDSNPAWARSGTLEYKDIPADKRNFKRMTMYCKPYTPTLLMYYERKHRQKLVLQLGDLSKLGFRPQDTLITPYLQRLQSNQLQWNLEVPDEPQISPNNHHGHEYNVLELTRGSGEKLFFFCGNLTGSGQPWIDVWSDIQTLSINDNLEKTIMAKASEAFRYVDRVLQELDDGTRISFALKRKPYRGELAYVVDVTVDHKGES